MSEQKSRAQGKPEPEPQQWWRYDDNRTVRIARIDGRMAHFVGGTVTDLDSLVSGTAWRCVGVETSAGSVMVGERRKNPDYRGDNRTVTVTRIADRGYVAVCPADANFEVGFPAADVASWPLAGPSANVRLSLVEQMRAEGYALEAPEVIAKRLGIPMVPIAPHPSPLSAKWARRAEIDRVLAEDARKWPAFATARKRSVMGVMERNESAGGAENILRALHEYEGARGGMRKPHPFASLEAVKTSGRHDVFWLNLYENARAIT